MKRKICLFGFVGALFFFSPLSDIFSQTLWRAALIHESAAEIPFLFEFDKEANSKISIINGEERIELQAESYGDSLKVDFEVYDASLVFAVKENEISGNWLRNNYGKTTVMPFRAVKKLKEKQSLLPSTYSAEGKWAVRFKGDSALAVGVFKQVGNEVRGTILTSTGDYRYLNGFTEENKLILSTFNGAFAFKFEADFTKPDEMTGVFYSGLSYLNMWTARRDENAALANPYDMVKIKSGIKPDFSFRDLNGKTVSLSDERFNNKVVIIQILGSWCPNCLDETQFLAQFHRQNRNKGVEVVGLAFERKNSFEEAKPFLEKMIKKFGAEYPILYAGKADRKEAAEKLSFLEQVLAFPTTIILDKKHQIRKIHTGFTGQGTGQYFEKFAREFEMMIEKMCSE
jgi:thiol-disulfide isomerase/thioredoxin